MEDVADAEVLAGQQHREPGQVAALAIPQESRICSTDTMTMNLFSIVGKCFVAAALVLAIAGCHKDAGLKATKSECDQACAHAVGLNNGTPDTLAQKCPALCIEREWTVGDVGCLSDAATYDGVKNCAVAAKVVLADEKMKQELQAAAEASRRAGEEKKKLETSIAEQQRKVDALLTQLSSATDEATRLALQKQLDAERAATEAILKGNRVPARGVCNCVPNDPLCSCL
jgi:hypothetical protein